MHMMPAVGVQPGWLRPQPRQRCVMMLFPVVLSGVAGNAEAGAGLSPALELGSRVSDSNRGRVRAGRAGQRPSPSAAPGPVARRLRRAGSCA
jgi:hypothetical protein